ncbi:MAG: hypothetical protein JST59_16805 [Actinobacteria bacterium]|nr:hypothetical protein [Actinomycetota bacterium]
MAADAGSRRIQELLNKKSPALGANLVEIANAAAVAPETPYGVMPQSGIQALADVRQFYRGLRRQIARIKTSDTATKTSALQSLDALDAAFGSYEQSLEFGVAEGALPMAQKAEKKARQAQKKMNSSIGGSPR